MAQEYTPDLAFDLTLWKRGESYTNISIGLGLNQDTRQLLFYFGDLTSDKEVTWWMVAGRQLHMLDFFLYHRIFFDGLRGGSSDRSRWRRRRETYDTHFEANSYERFKSLLSERIERGPGEQGAWISPKKLYALVEIIALIIFQTDYEERTGEAEFEDKWDRFLDILENESE
jgi:hypothetical protein